MPPSIDFTSLRVASPTGTTRAEFVPAAGMVCCSLIHLDEELLDSGKGLEAYAERGATMGIPLLYPWANRLEEFVYRVAGKEVRLPDDRTLIPQDPAGLPIHGVVPGRMRWQPEERDDDSRLAARLLWTSPELLELFPFAHEVRIEVAVTDGALTHTTIVRALGPDRVPVSFGYHPYLRLPGSRRQSWQVELPPSERQVLDERMIPTGRREPMRSDAFQLADSSWDDGFQLSSLPARFAVTVPGRGIAVDFLEGYPYAQIYAPPARDFICFEPMTAPTNALCSGEGLMVLAPGEDYRATFRISA